MNLTFDHESDELPTNRTKVQHSQGALARVQWIDRGGHIYSGLYKGDSIGLIRFSEGNFLVPEADGLTPTMAMKFPRDGM